MSIQTLIAKWEAYRKELINPDGIDSWDDLGFDEPPDGYESVDAYLEVDSEVVMDEARQVELGLVDQFLADLKVED